MGTGEVKETTTPSARTVPSCVARVRTTEFTVVMSVNPENVMEGGSTPKLQAAERPEPLASGHEKSSPAKPDVTPSNVACTDIYVVSSGEIPSKVTTMTPDLPAQGAPLPQAPPRPARKGSSATIRYRVTAGILSPRVTKPLDRSIAAIDKSISRDESRGGPPSRSSPIFSPLLFRFETARNSVGHRLGSGLSIAASVLSVGAGANSVGHDRRRRGAFRALRGGAKVAFVCSA